MTSNKKSRYTPAQARSAKKYINEKTDQITIRVPKGDKSYYKAIAEKNGESLNAYVIRAMKYLNEADNLHKEK